MPKFTYKALSQSGTTVVDTVESDSSETVTALIVSKGLIPTAVTQTAGGRASSGLQRFGRLLSGVKIEELILFTKQFRTMLHAGVPMVKLLEVLEGQAENPALKNIIGILSRDIQEGSSLHDLTTNGRCTRLRVSTSGLVRNPNCDITVSIHAPA